MYCDWFEDMPIIIKEKEEEHIKLSLKDRFAIWLINLGEE